ncbi:cytochrome c family protein [Pelagibius sp.]|uniref:c-type cytochrome n=1 Tax=Pelagibius sp. TaxID=1931238 RepID=UPI002638C54E|nr:cytochrome c family protein [Pelagibius sp.]
MTGIKQSKRITAGASALAVWLGAAAVSAPAGAQTTAGDAAAGELVFRQCAACHTVEPDRHRAGPSLYGVFGQQAGAVEGFRYSRAMREADVVWDEETLTAYLADPNGFLPGTSMRIALRNAEDAPDLIAYLRTLGAE